MASNSLWLTDVAIDSDTTGNFTFNDSGTAFFRAKVAAGGGTEVFNFINPMKLGAGNGLGITTAPTTTAVRVQGFIMP